jgi:hypothetical protein
MRIRPFSTPGRFWRGNLHAHSNLSDGALNPVDVVEAYKRAGYDFLQVSDHFLGRFDWPIADTRKLRCSTFTTLIGAEVHAMGTSAGEYWHIVATGLPFDFPPAEPGESAPRLAERARAAGAFVAIAHPSWSQLTIEDGRSLGAAHAVEVYNHTCAMLTDRGDGFYLLDQLCNEDRRLTAIAGDDAHFHNGDLDAFGGYVMVKSETLEPESLLGALKAGEFYSSQGPRIYNVEVTQNEVRVECSPVHTIALVTSASPALSRVGRGLTEATIEFSEVAKWAWATPPQVKWFRIVAIDGPRRRAWTNPIWVDALN